MSGPNVQAEGSGRVLRLKGQAEYSELLRNCAHILSIRVVGEAVSK